MRQEQPDRNCSHSSPNNKTEIDMDIQYRQ